MENIWRSERQQHFSEMVWFLRLECIPTGQCLAGEATEHIFIGQEKTAVMKSSVLPWDVALLPQRESVSGLPGAECSSSVQGMLPPSDTGSDLLPFLQEGEARLARKLVPLQLSPEFPH